MKTENEELLLELLNTPLDSGDAIFDRFKALPNAIYSCGKEPLQRYVYIQGTRQDRVVLVAHIDTVWDRAYGIEPKNHEIKLENGIFSSTSDACGIGADDRAGCAMLWKLRDCGHSILIVDGEEYGKRGANYLKKTNPRLFKTLNKHCFMIELDHIRTNHVSFAQVDNTKKFKNEFCQATGFKDYKLTGGCDLQVLCKSICGANVGVGYAYYHTSKEALSLKEWESTYNVLSAFLSKPQKRYKAPFLKRPLRFVKRCIIKCLKILKIKK